MSTHNIGFCKELTKIIFQLELFFYKKKQITPPFRNKTSSQKGNDRSPDSKSSKYFEYSRIKDFLNLSKEANFAVHVGSSRISNSFETI